MPKRHRLARADFQSSAPSRRVQGVLFSVSVSPLREGPAKFSCVVSKKVAPKAHDRNLLKRRCREIARPIIARSPRPRAFVLYARKGAAVASFGAIREDVSHLLQSAQ